VAELHRRELPLRQAVALGLLHGPSELLPISSSAHTALVPWLLGWSYGELDPSLRKSFEIALHAGTALALAACPPWQRRQERAQARFSSLSSTSPTRPAARLATLACAVGPPAAAGFLLGERIERRLGTPDTIAAGLLAGAIVMAATDLCGEGDRRSRTAQPRDGLALGAAQTLALMPGLSRSGMSAAAARMRGFARTDADRLCWQAGLPVIAGATLLKGVRQARAGVGAEHRRALAAGAAGAFCSTLVSTRALPPERRLRLLPAAVAYRVGLAGAVSARLRAGRAAGRAVSA